MTSVATTESHVADFLAMLTAERGASQNTIEAYTSDLEGYFGFLSERTVERPTQSARTFRPISPCWRTRASSGIALAAACRQSSSTTGSCRPKVSSTADPTSRLAGAEETARAAEGAEHRRGRPLAANLREALRRLGGRRVLPGSALSLPARNSLRDGHARLRARRAAARSAARRRARFYDQRQRRPRTPGAAQRDRACGARAISRGFRAPRQFSEWLFPSQRHLAMLRGKASRKT